ncbi:predicted protein [Naegleria gruberi]|uniref:Predicted protein n=1 Tax=Naegleria gruberi TaxID=5762 RepID=D2VGA0_NAEGR|nr:uncharacterized protein NAEGRDRAFT_49294 [Naegleria gruberi]EFC44233.1 predicted protein [Naegleria gruberi]|eukprot:XP_002676977.1 predicted protein [Naegleria gruberi strain NEG-M]
MKFNEEYSLIESEKIKSPFDIISLHTSESKIIAITADSRIIDIETLDQLLKIETDQYISDYHLLQKGYLCTEHGDIYSIDGNQANMLYSKLGVDKICKSSQEANFLIGYSSVSDLIYIPLEESMTDLQPRSLLPNISYVIDFDKKGDDFIIATPKRLCSVKKGMSCRVTSLTDESYDGIDNVFTPTTDFIILSFVNQSKVLRISEDSIDECNNNVFESSQATFYCNQILNSFILQVTATEMRLMDLQLSTLLSSIKINSTVITSKANNIYVSYENKITKFEVSQEGQITESFSITLDRDISSMRATDGNHLIASTYSGIIYFISGNTISKTIDINSQQIETNIVESIFYTGSLLLLGLRDGHLLVYDIDQLIKKFKLGDVPVQLRETFDDIIIAVSNNCYYISVDSSMNLNISNLLVNDHILSVQNFNVTGYENSLLCLSSDSKIKVISIETTNFQPMIKEIYSNEDCQRVHVNEEDNSIIYVCNNYSSLRYIDDSKETLTLYTFPPSEKIYSITSFKVKNDDSHDSNFVIVGTKYTRHHNNIIMNKDPTSLSHGLLHVLKLGKVSDSYKCEHVGSCELPYMVYSIKQYNSQYLLVGYGERLGLFYFDQKEMKLVDQASVRHFVNSIDICDNLICITDRFDGLLFYIIQEGKFYYLSNVSLRLDALNSSTCRFINSKRLATIDRSHQLIIWRINNINTSTHTISLSKEKSFDTKELALKVIPISNHQLFYITLNGSINYLNIEE